MVGCKMSETEYDLKAIMYPTYDTPNIYTLQYKGGLKYPAVLPNIIIVLSGIKFCDMVLICWVDYL